MKVYVYSPHMSLYGVKKFYLYLNFFILSRRSTSKQVLTLLKNILKTVAIRHCWRRADTALLLQNTQRVTEWKGNRTESANICPAMSHVARRGTNGRIHY